MTNVDSFIYIIFAKTFVLSLYFIVFFSNFFVAEHVDIDEAKSIFESNYSHVYFILYDTFVQAETNLRQRGKPQRNSFSLGHLR